NSRIAARRPRNDSARNAKRSAASSREMEPSVITLPYRGKPERNLKILREGIRPLVPPIDQHERGKRADSGIAEQSGGMAALGAVPVRAGMGDGAGGLQRG